MIIEPPPSTNARTRTRTRALTHARSNAHTHTHTQCYQRISFSFKLSCAIFLPLFFVLVVLVLAQLSSMTAKTPKKKEHRRNAGFSFAFWICFAFLPPASLVIFQCFVCDAVTNTLQADALVTCDISDIEFVYIRSLGILGAILWPIGFPLLSLMLLWRQYVSDWLIDVECVVMSNTINCFTGPNPTRV